MEVTRLAPSPTGALHLGNARTFLLNWLLAKRSNWQITLRIEDLDGPRVKSGADREAVADLAWLGIDWDSGPVRQSERTDLYASAVQRLLADGSAYPCVCTRKEVEQAASAPHAEDGSPVYPGTCRGRFASVAEARSASGREPAIRFRVPSDESAVVAWQDHLAGPRKIDVRQLGDFVISKADKTAAYQLAVVVDDAAAGVTQVVRGDDLLDSTPRQILLYRALGWSDRVPQYWHAPLVVGTDGRRLAKRHGDSRLSHYRSLGVGPQQVLRLLARWLGVTAVDQIATSRDLVHVFDPARVSRQPIVFGEADDRRLRSISG